MLIRYVGPSPSVLVVPYGEQLAGQAKEYPDAFGQELLDTSKKQRFEAVEPAPNGVDVPDSPDAAPLRKKKR
jgi:hypothetical protein